MTDFALLRYNTDGSLDTTFSTGGIVTTDIGGVESIANRVLIASDGKILVEGTKNISYSNYFMIARYNSNGTLDTSFGTGSS